MKDQEKGEGKRRGEMKKCRRQISISRKKYYDEDDALT